MVFLMAEPGEWKTEDDEIRSDCMDLYHSIVRERRGNDAALNAVSAIRDNVDRKRIAEAMKGKYITDAYEVCGQNPSIEVREFAVDEAVKNGRFDFLSFMVNFYPKEEATYALDAIVKAGRWDALSDAWDPRYIKWSDIIPEVKAAFKGAGIAGVEAASKLNDEGALRGFALYGTPEAQAAAKKLVPGFKPEKLKSF